MSTSDLTIFIVPPGRLRAITSALRDWTAAGVAREHAVISLDALDSGLASYVQREVVTTVRTSALLAQSRPERARVVLLSEQGSEDESRNDQHIASVVDQLERGGGRCTWVRAHVILTRPGVANQPRSTDGWHTLVLSPEDSYGPGQAHDTLPPTDGSGYAIYDAPTVAVLAGVLHGQDRAPIDEWPLLPDRQVRVVRAFVRRLDAAALENELRARTHDLTDGFPRPRYETENAAYHLQPEKACSTMADSLWQLVAAVFENDRVSQPRQARTRIGIGESLRMFAAFMIAAIRRAPMAWLNHTLARGRARLEGSVESLVFGSGSKYLVILGGDKGAGELPSSDEVRVALDHAARSMGVGDTEQGMSDVKPLWKAYVDACLTLIDGERRHPQLAVLAQSGRPAIIKRAEDIAPIGAEIFEVTEWGIRAHVQIHPVHAEDVRETSALERSLSALQDDARLGVAASRELQRLRQWRAGHAASFTSQTMQRISSALETRLDEVTRHAETINRAAAAPDQRASRAQQQRKLSRIVVAAVVFAVIAVTGLIVGGALGAIAWAVAGGVSVLLVVCALGAAFLAFSRGQQQLFRELHQQRQAMDGLSAAKANVVVALREAQLLQRTYDQALLWSRLMAAFVRQPLSKAKLDETRSGSLAQPRPHGVAFGVAMSTEVATARVAEQLRDDTFVKGWTTDVWAGFIASAAQQLGVRGVRLKGASDDLLSLDPEEAETILAGWLEVLASQGQCSDAGDVLWAVTRERLIANDDHLQQLIGGVQVGHEGSAGSITSGLDDFMNAVSARAHPNEALAPAAFSPLAVSSGHHQIGQEWPFLAAVGLGRLGLLVQSTGGLSPQSLQRDPMPIGQGKPVPEEPDDIVF